MNKEKLMQFLSEAIDKGAKIEVILHSASTGTQEEAKGYAKKLGDIVDAPVTVAENNSCEWFKVRSDKVSGSFFHKDSHIKTYKNPSWMEEDVDLSGSEDIA